MFKPRFAFIVFTIIYSHAKPTEKLTTNTPKYDIRSMLIEEGVIPDVLPDLKNYTICKVVYNNTIEVIPGQHLPARYCVSEPNVTWEADNETYHTLYLCASNRWLTESYGTPDPAREGFDYPRKMEWESWAIINIPGNDVSKGHQYADYVAPAYSLSHQIKERYLFLIYEQPYKFDTTALDALNGEQWPYSLKLKDFVIMYNLTGPIAVNYFTMQWDKSFFSTMSSLQWEFSVKNNFSPPTTQTLSYYRRGTRTFPPRFLKIVQATDWRYLITYKDYDKI